MHPRQKGFVLQCSQHSFIMCTANRALLEKMLVELTLNFGGRTKQGSKSDGRPRHELQDKTVGGPTDRLILELLSWKGILTRMEFCKPLILTIFQYWNMVDRAC